MKLFIDVETFSSVDIKKSGGYKYCESLDFEIMLLAYAYDNEPVKIIDFMLGEKMPESLINDLTNPDIEKHAHNAVFERNAFKAIGINIPTEQIYCTSIKALYCGLPGSLDNISKVMHLNEFGKLATGKALIKYFCTPCKPTESNGHRSRNLPKHDMDKWNDFKTYNIHDVIAEREIDTRLDKYVIPNFERQMYLLDQRINDRGVLIDSILASSAYAINEEYSVILKQKITSLTGVENPRSLPSMKAWFKSKLGYEVKSLSKESMPELIADAKDDVTKEVLKLYQMNSITSTKKYATMLMCESFEDGRIRGLYQHYGANRTGRWAGRLVQLHNLSKNNMDDDKLDMARTLVRSRELDLLIDAFDNIPNVLSQLVRTSFVAPDNETLAVADFSAIEARVIAWLANEKWRLKVFQGDGKIYEASAALIFGVPVESIGKHSNERKIGKVAELALGYQGAVGAFAKMGGEKLGLTEDGIKKIVNTWRNKNPRITKLWNDVNKAAIEAVKSKRKIKLSDFRNLIFESNGEVLTIQLPSGRKLFYQSPSITINTFGAESVRYKGLDQTTGKWVHIDSYGGKFVENIVQAIARDLLAVIMMRLDNRGFKLTIHVHDEVIAEVKKSEQKAKLNEMLDIMAEPISWARGLPLVGDGYLTDYYKKDND